MAEQAHDAVKSALAQALVVRGHRDFPTLDAYDAFLHDVVERRCNQPVAAALAAERPHLQPLPAAPVPNYTHFHPRVRRWSTIRFGSRTYSVPARLIGHEVEVRQYPDVVEVYYRGQLAERMPRVHGPVDHRIDYRHIIWSLVRKPGAFARYRYREELFPSLVFRQAYDVLQAARGARADVEYVRILHLAASTLEATVAAALAILLRAGAPFDYAAVKALAAPEPTSVPAPHAPRTRSRRLRWPAGREPAMKAAVFAPRQAERLTTLLRQFQLTTLATELIPRFEQAGQQEVLPLLLEVYELEAQARTERRIARLRAAAKLPPGKTFTTFEERRLPRPLVQQLRELATGAFLDGAVNVLAFGLPGVGKSHAACALGHALVEAGHSVRFTPTYQLVQELLAAKRDLELPRLLHKLDAFELLILDDLGYVRQSAEEAEVLFTLLAERYERRSVLITSNLVFSEWERIFKNPMATAAAIDRLVHHAVILELAVPSYRTEDAKKRSVATKSEAAAVS